MACRQYRLEGEAASVDGIACREGGVWRMRAALAVPSSSQNVDVYQTAGAGGTDPLTAVLDGLGNPSVLDADEEAAAIASGWTRVSP